VKVNAIKENSGLSSGNLDVAAKALNSTASLARMSEATSGACVWLILQVASLMRATR